MLHTKFHDNQPSGLGDFWSVFTLKKRWRPSWSYDLDLTNKLLFPHPKDVPHEIWRQSAQWFQRRRCLKMFNKLLFPHPKDVPHEIWRQSAQWFQRRRCLKMLTDNRLQMTTEASHTISSPVSQRLRWAKIEISAFSNKKNLTRPLHERNYSFIY